MAYLSYDMSWDTSNNKAWRPVPCHDANMYIILAWYLRTEWHNWSYKNGPFDYSSRFLWRELHSIELDYFLGRQISYVRYSNVLSLAPACGDEASMGSFGQKLLLETCQVRLCIYNRSSFNFGPLAVFVSFAKTTLYYSFPPPSATRQKHVQKVQHAMFHR